MKTELNDCKVVLLSDSEMSSINGGFNLAMELFTAYCAIGTFCYQLGKDGKSADSYKGN